MQTEIEWPGMPEIFQMPFKDIKYQDDLFSWAALQQLDEFIDDDDEVDEETEETWNEN